MYEQRMGEKVVCLETGGGWDLEDAEWADKR